MKCLRCDYPIVNVKYQLCSKHNFERLHNGASRAEVYKERISQRVEAKQPKLIRSKYKPKQQTSTEKEIKQQLSILKHSIEEDALSNNEYHCWGCGNGSNGLDKSHILSVKQRKDLELDRANINLFCRSCHNNWENNDIAKMIMLNSFEKDLNYIKSKDWRRYNSILHMINECIMKQFDQLFINRASIDSRLVEKLNYFGDNFSYIEK